MLIKEVIELFLHDRKVKQNASPYTIKTYVYALKVFTSFMEDERNRTSYQEITRMDIITFTDHMRSRRDTGEWSQSKYLLVLKTLKAMFRWMETDEDCREEELKSWRDRLPKGGKTPRRDYIPSPIDLKRWQKAFNTKTMTGFRDYMMFNVLLETGLRRGELASITVQNVQLDRNLIYVTGKGGDRIVTITKGLSESIKTYLKRRERSKFKDSAYLFPSHGTDGPADPNYITKVFARIRKKLGLPNLTPHTLRHCFCSYYLINGGDLEKMRVQSGHKTYDAMLHYMHLAKVGGQQVASELEKASPLHMLSKVR